jgi:hypothetical protein
MPLSAITPGATWTASVTGTGLTLSTKSAIGSGESRDVIVAANTGLTRRAGTVTIKSGAVSATVVVIQDTTRVVGLSRTTWAAAPGGAQVTAGVTTWNQATWTATVSEPWILLGAGAGGDGDDITIVARPNTTGAPRAGTITVHSGGGAATLTITQRE